MKYIYLGYSFFRKVRLFMETLRVYKRSVLGIIIILFMINLFFFVQQEGNISEEEMIYGENYDYTEYIKNSDNEYSKAIKYYTGWDNDSIMTDVNEKLSVLSTENETDIYKINAYNRVVEQIEYYKEYKTKYQNICDNAKQMSSIEIFAENNSYSRLNIEKTVEDFKKVSNVKTEIVNDKVIDVWSDYEITDYIVLLIMILIIMQFLSERKIGLWSIIHSLKKGRLSLTIKRTGILAISSVIISAIFYLSTLLISINMYGAINWSASIQSIQSFENCSIPLNIGEYILSVYLIKAAGIFTIAVLIWIILSVISKMNIAILITAIIMGAEYISYVKVTDISNMVLLKYINPFAFLNTNNLFRNYLNIFIFGKPVFILNFCIVVLLLLCIVGVGVNIIVNPRKYPVSSPNIIEKYTDNISRWLNNFVNGTNIFLHEGYKLLWALKGIIVVMFVICIALLSQNYKPLLYDGVSTNLNKYYKELLNVSIEDSEQYFDKWQEEIDELSLKPEMFNQIEDKKKALDIILKHKDKLKEIKENTGIEVKFVNPFGYNSLIGDAGAKRREKNAMIELLCIALIIGGFASIDKQNNSMAIIRTTKMGIKKTYGIKMIWTFIASIIIVAPISYVEFENVIGRMGLSDLTAPVQSFVALGKFPLKISLIQYILLMYIVRLISAYIVGIIVLEISEMCSNTRIGQMLNVCIIVVPAVLLYMNIDEVKYLALSNSVGISDISKVIHIVVPVVIAIVVFMIRHCREHKDRI